MDILSYLLGKKSSGGGGGSVSDYFITKIYDNETGVASGLIKKLPILDYDEMTLSATAISDLPNLEEIDGIINTDGLEDTSMMFENNTSLKTVPLFNTSNVWYMNDMFNGCSSLISVPQFNTQTCTVMDNMFYNCKSLTTIPLFDTTNVESMSAFIDGTHKGSIHNYTEVLTDTSLDNILQMCINAVNYSGTKTLVAIGFHQEAYSSARIQALPHYADFISAGWTIGY